jgi:hypothetical protein
LVVFFGCRTTVETDNSQAVSKTRLDRETGGRYAVADIADSAEHALPRLTFWKRIGRGVIGFCLGCVWCLIFSLGWVGALTVGYGGLDRGLTLFKDEWWARIAFAAYLGSLTGSWVGGTMGPVGLRPSRHRPSILVSSFLGGAAAAVLAAIVGALVGWMVWRESPGSMLIVQLPLILGVLLGVLAGWLAGRLLTRPIRAPGDMVSALGSEKETR